MGKRSGVAGLGGEVAGVEQLGAAEGGDGPVVVLAGAVDAREGLLLEERGEAVLAGDLLADLHHHEVLVRLDDDGAEEGRELVLVGRHLPVTGLEGDAELVALLLDLLHAAVHLRLDVDGAHVVVAELLASRGHLAHDGAAGELEVHAALVGLAGDEEELLLEADVVHGALDLEAAVLEEPRGFLGHCLVRAVERGLLVERLAVVGDEAGGNEDVVVAHEGRGGGVDAEVAARGVRRAHAAVGVGGTVRLAEEDVLALELKGGGAVVVELEGAELHLAGHTVAEGGRHGLEPVAERGGAGIEAPLEESLGDLISLGAVVDPGVIVEVGGGHADSLEVLVGDGALKDGLTIALGELGLRNGTRNRGLDTGEPRGNVQCGESNSGEFGRMRSKIPNAIARRSGVKGGKRTASIVWDISNGCVRVFSRPQSGLCTSGACV